MIKVYRLFFHACTAEQKLFSRLVFHPVLVSFILQCNSLMLIYIFFAALNFRRVSQSLIVAIFKRSLLIIVDGLMSSYLVSSQFEISTQCSVL